MRKIGVGGVIEAGSDLSRNGDPSEMKILGFINFKKKNAVPEFEQRVKKCFAAILTGFHWTALQTSFQLTLVINVVLRMPYLNGFHLSYSYE